MSRVAIVGAKRTPIGSFQGALNGVPSPVLGATAIQAALAQAGVSGEQVHELLMGCVLPAGLGQAPARQAGLKAGLPLCVGATTLNKVCGSGMKAIMLGSDAIKAGSAGIVVAGGMESMSNAPYLLAKARGGYRYGHDKVYDHMALDGLENAADGKAMGEFGEVCAAKYDFTREKQDAFSSESVRRAVAAREHFAAEIVGVKVAGRKGEVLVDADEEPARCDLSKIPTLRAAFRKDGTITAASSSKISDGAAAVVLASEAEVARLGLTPLAWISGYTTHSQEPEWFTTAPGPAINRLRERLGWSAEDVDLYEVNEAFAVVAMAAMVDCGIPHEKINIWGGACALGHPIGATGARLVVTLLNALRRTGGKRGIASLCIGGGEGTALAVELA
jgi:acetyl-CoA C-acetyltransferase